jgi:protein-L-isoaspartate(D-aspartate) O-methyltransferase
MTELDRARFNMVESQVRPNGVTGERLLAAMMEVPRENFVPESCRVVAYAGCDVPYGVGRRSLPEPMSFARLVQMAEPRPSDSVLLVGDGTGYGAAVLSSVAAKVVSLENEPALAAKAKNNLEGVSNATVYEGALEDGCRNMQPFDVIIVLGRAEAVPEKLFSQLAEGGRLIAAVGRAAVVPAQIWTMTKGSRSVRQGFDVALPFLPGFAAREAEFVF